jgi:hypothetical protein
MADMVNHHIAELASFRMNPVEKKVYLTLRKEGDAPLPVFTPSSSVRALLESRFDTQALSEHTLLRDGKPVTPEQLADMPVSTLKSLRQNQETRTIEILSK